MHLQVLQESTSTKMEVSTTISRTKSPESLFLSPSRPKQSTSSGASLPAVLLLLSRPLLLPPPQHSPHPIPIFTAQSVQHPLTSGRNTPTPQPLSSLSTASWVSAARRRKR